MRALGTIPSETKKSSVLSKDQNLEPPDTVLDHRKFCLVQAGMAEDELSDESWVHSRNSVTLRDIYRSSRKQEPSLPPLHLLSTSWRKLKCKLLAGTLRTLQRPGATLQSRSGECRQWVWERIRPGLTQKITGLKILGFMLN